MEILVDEKGKFEYYSYRNEKELEEFVYKTSEEIFGKNTYYIELKKSLGKGRLSYPDGYVIDLSDTENPALYIVEAELEKHDVYRHIYPQITMHLNFFKKNKMKVKNDLEKAIKKNVSCKASIEKRIHNTKFQSIPDLVYEVVYRVPVSLVIMIDRKNEDLAEVVTNNIAKFSDTKIVEFQTFAAIKGSKKSYIHKFEPLFEEVGESKQEIGTWYKLVLSDIEYQKESRKLFDPKHNVSKYAQGFVYSKNERNEIDGIVVLWYKSNIDEHMIDAKRDYVATGRPLNPENLWVGMDVFLAELQYDRRMGKRINDPKIRVHGKLKEVIRVDGDVESKIFPI